MKTVMLLLAAGLILAACSGSRHSTAAKNLEGEWQLVMFPSGNKQFTEIFTARIPELKFEADSSHVGGNTGCNHLSGSFTTDGTNFSFGNNMITTKMACPGYEENLFMEALSKVNNYTIVNNQLHFRQDTTLVMAFAKKTASQ